MYGTVARMRVKPGMESVFTKQMEEFEANLPKGATATYCYRMDSNPNEYYLAVVWDTKENYVANANSPEQNARYQDYVRALEGAPEWHDGEIVYAATYRPKAGG
jgi:hypothetical protein